MSAQEDSRPPCAGQLQLFFPKHGESYEPGLKLCTTCPTETKADCAELGRVSEVMGIWGGRITGKVVKCVQCGDRYYPVMGAGKKLCNRCASRNVPHCAFCGIPFRVKNKGQRYCSRKCSAQDLRSS
jgi:hypothetical protein